MDKIEMGEYIRTTDGKIGVFVKYSSRKDNSIYKSPFDCFIRLKNRKSNLQCHRDYIVKHSKNIIDLIEAGDVVEVLDIDWIRIFNIDNEDILNDFKEEIEEKNWKLLSILTKEMYEQNCYRVEKESRNNEILK